MDVRSRGVKEISRAFRGLAPAIACGIAVFLAGGGRAAKAQGFTPAAPASQASLYYSYDPAQAAPASAPADLEAPAASAPAAPDGFIVVPFDNLTGNGNLEPLRIGFLAAAAEQLQDDVSLRPVFGADLLPQGATAKMSPDDVVALARRVGASYVVAGSFSRPGWVLQVGVRVLWVGDLTTRELASASASGSLKDPIGVMDQALAKAMGAAGLLAPGSLPFRPTTRDAYAFWLYAHALGLATGFEGGKQLDTAKKTLEHAVKVDPKYAQAHRLLGYLARLAGDRGLSRLELGRALELRPDDFEALAGLAQLDYDDKRMADARADVERALAAHPYDADMRFLHGQLLFEAGDLDDAENELQAVVRDDERHLPARRLLVMIAASRGENQELAEQLEEIVSIDPTDMGSQLDLAAAYRVLGRDDDAIQVYQQILEKQPRHVTALKMLGDIYRAKGDAPNAIDYYSRAIKANPRDPRAYFLLGSMYAATGQDRKAEKIFLAAQDFPDYLGETYEDLGAIYLRRGDLDQAVWYEMRAVHVTPDKPRAHMDYALVLDAERKWNAALAEMKQAADLDPGDARVQYNLGVLYLRVGRADLAEAAFKQAAALDPHDDDARHNLALLAELRRRAQEGEVQLK